MTNVFHSFIFLATILTITSALPSNYPSDILPGSSPRSLTLGSGYPGDPLIAGPPTPRTRRSTNPGDPDTVDFPRQMVRREDIPKRPGGVLDTSFHRLHFEHLETTDYAPAVDAMPDPCYPEGGTNAKGNNENPGTDGSHGTASVNPGADCINPGTYHGAYTRGNPFPVYVSAKWCKDHWRIDYDLYYVHDGVLMEGHKHDWDSGVTMIWKEDPKHQDWFFRDSAIYHKHQWLDRFDWKDLRTVDDDSGDVREDSIGRNKKHPKVYVGFFSHAAFANKDTSRKTMTGPATEAIANDEYRSDDWYYMPGRGDIHSYKDINPKWNYGKATGTPPEHYDVMCGL